MDRTPKYIKKALKKHRFSFRKRVVYVDVEPQENDVIISPDEISDKDYERMLEEDRKATALFEEDDYEEEELYSSPYQYKGEDPVEEPQYSEEEKKELDKFKKSAEKIEKKIKKRERRISGKKSKKSSSSRFEVYDEPEYETPEEREKRLLYESINGDGYYNTELLPIDYRDKAVKRKKFHINKYNLPILILIGILTVILILTTIHLFS